MAVPSFNISGFLDLISNCDAGTDWSITDVDTDIKVEGVGAGFDAIRDGTTITYTFPASVDMSGTDIHIRQWLMHTFPAKLQTKANGGIQLFIDDGSNVAYWYVGGSDTHAGSWELFQADLAATPDSGTLPVLTAITDFGFVLDHATSARNVANTYWDICTFAKGYEIYGGTTVDKVSWDTLATADTGSTTSLQYGVVELIRGGAYYLNSGLWLGDSNSTNDLYFDGTNQTIIFYDLDEKTGLYKIIGSGNSTGTTDIDLSGSVLKSASSAFILDMSGTNVSAFKMDGSKVENASASSFKSGQSIQGTVFSECGTISHNGSTFEGSTVILSGLITVTASGTFKDNIIDEPTGTVGVSVVTFDNVTGNTVNSDGTGHAFDLGTILANDTMSWSNFDTGYASSDGTTGNETILVSVNTGITLTINVATGATTPTVYNTGLGTVNVVSGQVTTILTIIDAITTNIIVGARVLVMAGATGNLHNNVTVTITRVTTTATVAHTAHGLEVGEKVYIWGSTIEAEYKGVKTITAITTDTYDFNVTGTPTTPATGTISSTYVIIDDDSDANGEVSDTRSLSVDQSTTGKARKATVSPLYQTTAINATISSSSGLTQNIQMISDE